MVERTAALEKAQHLSRQHDEALDVLARRVATAQALRLDAEEQLRRARAALEHAERSGARFVFAVPLSLFLGMCAAAVHAVLHTSLVPGTLDDGGWCAMVRAVGQEGGRR